MSKPTIENPYAKSKSNVTASTMSRSTTSVSTRPANAASAAARSLPQPSVSSFSQAFEAMEDTTHYQNEAQRSTLNDADASRAQTRAQQRAFDQAAQQHVDASSHASFSDRDHHKLLQPHVLYVSTKQRGNAVLNYIRNVPYAFSKMIPDYILSTTRCALFLSTKYHSLHPDYIHKRIAELGTDFTLRILLVLVDLQDNANILLVLNKLAVTHNLTLILVWSEEEAARYLETYKAFDGKDASLIQKKEQTNFVDQAADVLSKASVNKTDSAQLLTQFGTFRSIASASMDELGLVAGMGPTKVKRLHDAFYKPFSSRAAKKRRQQRQAQADAAEEAQLKDDDDDDDQGVVVVNKGATKTVENNESEAD